MDTLRGKRIGYVGKPYKPYLDYLEERGIEVHCFRPRGRSFRYPAGVRGVYDIDLASKEAAHASLDQVRDVALDGVVALYEDDLLPRQWIGSFFDVPVPTEEVILAATDKSRMRQRLAARDSTLCPAFAEVASWSDIEQFLETADFPLILKPAHLQKSLLISRADSREELETIFSDTTGQLAAVYEHYGVTHRSPKLLLEEFLAGSVHSADCVVDHEGAIVVLPVVDIQTAKERGINDTHHFARHLPSVLSGGEQDAVIKAAKRSVAALGLTASAAHVELVLQRGEPKIIEIGARTGGYRPRMYQLAADIDEYGLELRAALGEPLPHERGPGHVAGYSSAYEFFPERDGALRAVHGVDELRGFEAARYVSSIPASGTAVGLARNGYKAPLRVVLGHAKREIYERARAFTESSVAIDVA